MFPQRCFKTDSFNIVIVTSVCMYASYDAFVICFQRFDGGWNEEDDMCASPGPVAAGNILAATYHSIMPFMTLSWGQSMVKLLKAVAPELQAAFIHPTGKMYIAFIFSRS